MRRVAVLLVVVCASLGVGAVTAGADHAPPTARAKDSHRPGAPAARASAPVPLATAPVALATAPVTRGSATVARRRALDRALHLFMARLARPQPAGPIHPRVQIVPRANASPGSTCPVATGSVCSTRPCRLFTVAAGSATVVIRRASGPLAARRTCSSPPPARTEPISASSGTG